MKGKVIVFGGFFVALIVIVAAAVFLNRMPADDAEPFDAADEVVMQDDAIEYDLDIAYGELDSQSYDVFYEPGVEDAPVVFIVHGGSGTGDKANMRNRVPLYLDLGFVVVAPNYQYADGTKIPSIEDTACSMAHFVTQADQYGADPTKILVHGNSGGANKTAIIFYDQETDYFEDCPYEADVQIFGFIGEAGNYGLVYDESDNVEFTDEGIVTGPKKFVQEQRATYGDNVRPNLGALNYATSDGPPALFLHGTNDAVASPKRAEDFSERLDELGVFNVLYLVDEGGHSLHIETRPDVINAIERFVEEVL